MRPKLKMLWPYKHDDVTTWKYLDCVLSGEYCRRKIVHRWILNPDFKYKHLDPEYSRS